MGGFFLNIEAQVLPIQDYGYNVGSFFLVAFLLLLLTRCFNTGLGLFLIG